MGKTLLISSHILSELEAGEKNIHTVDLSVEAEQIAQDLRDYVPGWKAYFRLAQTPTTMHELDAWLRHRLRAIQLRQWRRGRTTYRAVRALGASPIAAAVIAANAHRCWRFSHKDLNAVLTIEYFDRLGVPRFS